MGGWLPTTPAMLLCSHQIHRSPLLACITHPPVRRDEGIPAAEVRVSPQPVTAELLLTSTRLNRSMAEASVMALAAGSFLDAVRRGCWPMLLGKRVPYLPSQVAKSHCLLQEASRPPPPASHLSFAALPAPHAAARLSAAGSASRAGGVAGGATARAWQRGLGGRRQGCWSGAMHRCDAPGLGSGSVDVAML